jgi:hypothetical protein
VTRTGRGSTRPGVRAVLPEGSYVPQPVRQDQSTGGWVVEFAGEDGRRRTFDFAVCPLPGWHRDLAGALEARVGPAGGLRTSTSSLAAWNNLRLFLRFLAALPEPPERPSELTSAHTAAFLAAELERGGPVYGYRKVDHVWRVLRLAPVVDNLDAEAVSALQIRTVAARPAGTAGYSDHELKQILAAARGDTTRLVERLRAADQLLERLDAQPLRQGIAERREALRLRAVAEHGLPAPDKYGNNLFQHREQLAEPLFVTRRDVPALMVLLVALTGWNVETIKELPAKHRVLDGRAVEIQVTKRRRGAGNWVQTVTWEIGSPGRELHHPGGLYLLLYDLMNRGRRLSTDPTSFWAVWRNLRRSVNSTVDEIGSPFRAALTAGIPVKEWAVEQHRLRDDDRKPLAVDFRRLRTSVEVRRVRALGGHLPSAARSNSTAVLFSNYLRGDPTAREWAQEVTGTALADAEKAALAAYRHNQAYASAPTVTTAADETSRPFSAEQGPWGGCRDVTAHPATGTRCRASFLDCFHCGNCLITADHLPSLLSLLDALDERRQQVSDDQWWARYGPAAAAIRTDVLPRFTPAELARARQAPALPAMLDLVEQPWEQP